LEGIWLYYFRGRKEIQMNILSKMNKVKPLRTATRMEKTKTSNILPTMKNGSSRLKLF
jgi:hypothetical protein